MARTGQFVWGLAALLLLAAQARLPAGEPARKDAFGDPLPASALARLGTTRVRPYWRGVYWCFALAPNGQSYATVDVKAVQLYSVKTGEIIHRWPKSKSYSSSLRFSPDGRTLAISEKGTVRLCELGGQWGVTKLQLGESENHVAIPLFSADSKRVMQHKVSGYSRSKSHWKMAVADIRQQKIVGTITASPETLALSPDGKILATLGEKQGDGVSPTLQVWEVDSGKEIRQHTFADKWVLAFAFSPDGKQLAVLESTGAVRFWNLQTGKFTTQYLNAGMFGMYQLRYTPDSKSLVFSTHEGAVTLLDIASGDCKTFPKSTSRGYLVDLAVLPDGTLRALGLRGNSTCVWELPSGKVLTPVQGHTGSVFDLVFSADRRSLLSSSSDGIRLWDLAPTDSQPGRLCVRQFNIPEKDPRGPRNPADPSLYFLAPGSAPFLVPVSLAAELSALAWQGERVETDWGGYGLSQTSLFTDDGKLAHFIGISGFHKPDGVIGVDLWDLKNGLRKGGFSAIQPKDEQLVVSVDPRYSALSADRRFLALRNVVKRDMTPADVLIVWDLPAGKEVLHQVRDKEKIQSLAFAPDNRLLLAAFENAGGVEVWDVRKAMRRSLLKVDLLPEVPPFLRFSPDGRLLVAATQTGLGEKAAGRLVVWETASCSVRHIFSPGERISSLAFSADSQILASGGEDGTILLWSMAGNPEAGQAADKLTAEKTAEMWEWLANPDAAKAFPAMRRLIRNPTAALALCRSKVELGQMQKEEPNSEQFALETLAPAVLRQVRVVEILERIGSADARELLRVWAKGDTNVRLTREAAAAVRKTYNMPVQRHFPAP